MDLANACVEWAHEVAHACPRKRRVPVGDRRQVTARLAALRDRVPEGGAEGAADGDVAALRAAREEADRLEERTSVSRQVRAVVPESDAPSMIAT
jgi:hypothetical protein